MGRRRRAARSIAVVAAATSLASCGVDPTASVELSGPTTSTTAARRRATTTTATTTVVDGIIVARIGDPVTTRSGNVVTVHELEWPLDDPAAEPDLALGAADVEACAGDTDGASGVRPAFFELEMDDRTSWPAVDPVAEPALHETRLAAGRCVRGWITFAAPADADPVLVALRTSTVAAWTVTP